MVSDIDLSQFHTIFFEECTEGIEIMESGLLNLEIGEPDEELINTIFRAAHSIKGGAGTFGFNDISDFTHTMETLLDEMRDGRIKATQAIVDVLLESVDYLRKFMNCSKSGETINKNEAIELQQRLSTLSNESQADDSASEAGQVNNVNYVDGWKISFFPHENLFYTGNDPFRLIRELQTLGELTVHADLKKLPEFSELQPQLCYLGWEMLLDGDVKPDQVMDVFAWVEDDCELDIKPKTERRKQQDRRGDTEEPKRFGRRISDTETTSIRVDINKIDELVNLVGELVISQSILITTCCCPNTS